MTDFVLTVGFLAQPPVPKQDGITSVALTVSPNYANANALTTNRGDTIAWQIDDSGSTWAQGTRMVMISIGRITGTVLKTEFAFRAGSQETFTPSTGPELPPGVFDAYDLKSSGSSPVDRLELLVESNSPTSTIQAYQYRILFRSSLGEWWIDPEIDVCPP